MRRHRPTTGIPLRRRSVRLVVIGSTLAVLVRWSTNYWRSLSAWPENVHVTLPITTTTARQSLSTLPPTASPIVRAPPPRAAPPSINISFVNVTRDDSERTHPHAGALDENGTPGYVHDETALRRNPPHFTLPTEELRRLCQIRDADFFMLTQKVYADIEYDQHMNQQSRQRIFCMVYSADVYHANLAVIRETWGYVRSLSRA
jgi:hypothetical protein